MKIEIIIRLKKSKSMKERSSMNNKRLYNTILLKHNNKNTANYKDKMYKDGDKNKNKKKNENVNKNRINNNKRRRRES